MKKSVVVQMREDFEARPIANLVQMANKYASKIYLEMGDARVNAKSIMGMMGLALMNGATVIVDAEGDDEKEAIDAIARFLGE